MMLVDANVLLDIFTADPVWLVWSRDALARALLTRDTVINPIIYSEVSMAFRRPEELTPSWRLLASAKLHFPMRPPFRPARHFSPTAGAAERRPPRFPIFLSGLTPMSKAAIFSPGMRRGIAPIFQK
jgi:predicted nucleic acid-binding protein